MCLLLCVILTVHFLREKKNSSATVISCQVYRILCQCQLFFLFYVYINHYFFLRHSRNPFFKMIPADRMPFVYKSLRFIDNVTLKMTIDYSFPILLFTYFQAKIQNEMVFCCTPLSPFFNANHFLVLLSHIFPFSITLHISKNSVENTLACIVQPTLFSAAA